METILILLSTALQAKLCWGIPDTTLRNLTYLRMYTLTALLLTENIKVEILSPVIKRQWRQATRTRSTS